MLAAGRELADYTASGQLSSAPSRPALNESITKSAGGRSFRLKNDIWIESSLLELSNREPERIPFNSPAYWRLASEHPELREILALGVRVKFSLGGKIYEVTD